MAVVVGASVLAVGGSMVAMLVLGKDSGVVGARVAVLAVGVAGCLAYLLTWAAQKDDSDRLITHSTAEKVLVRAGYALMCGFGLFAFFFAGGLLLHFLD